MEQNYANENAKLTLVTNMILSFNPETQAPINLIKPLHVLRGLVPLAQPQYFMDQIDPLLDFLYNLLKPTYLPYSAFNQVQENDQTQAVCAIFKFFIFATYTYNALKQKSAKKINFQIHFDRFVNLFREVKVDQINFKGITTRGNVLVFGAAFNYTPSPSYFLQISATVKFLVEFHQQNFDKLATILHQLLLISDSNAMQFMNQSSFPPGVILSGNPNIAYSVIQNLSFLDEINLVQNKENELVFKSMSVAQMLQRQIFVQNYINESKKSIRNPKLYSKSINKLNQIDSLCLIQFENDLDFFINRARGYINQYIEEDKVDEKFHVEFLNHLENQRSDEIRLFLMNQKKKSVDLTDLIQQLVQISNNEPKMAVLIGKALGECRFLRQEDIIHQFKFLASKIAFQNSRQTELVEVFKQHFQQIFTTQDLLVLFAKQYDEGIANIVLEINPQITYMLDQSQENYNIMINNGQIQQFAQIYQVLKDKKLFLTQFIENSFSGFLEIILSNVNILDHDNIESKCLFKCYQNTQNIDYIKGIIKQNPALLHSIDILNKLTSEEVYQSLLQADQLGKIQTEMFSKQQETLEKQKESGLIIDGRTDLGVVKDELNFQINLLNTRVTQLKKGYCWYQLGQQQYYWGRAELFTQKEAIRYVETIQLLDKHNYISHNDAQQLLD